MIRNSFLIISILSLFYGMVFLLIPEWFVNFSEAKNTNIAWLRSIGASIIGLRYFNVFGPGQSSEGHYAPVMARFENQDKSGLPLTVTGDGTQTRDFVHLDDVVAANYMAAKCDKSLCDGSVYNIGSGRSHRIIDIARSISDNIEFTPSRSAEVRHSTANIDRAKAKLDWTPKREGFTI